MALKEQLAKQTWMSIITTASATLLGIVTLIVLTKSLPREDIAIMGISSGFLAIMTPLLLSPDIMLFRNYAEFKKEFNKTLSAFLLFWVVRTAVTMIIIIAGGWIFYASRNDLLFLYLIGAGLVMNLNMLQASIQEVFYVEMRQNEILRITLLFHFLSLLFLGLVLLKPELLIYLIGWLGLSILASLAWVVRLMRGFRFKMVVNLKESFSTLKKIIAKVVIWTHFMGSVTNMIYRADVFFLAFFVSSFTTGNYTIAVMIGSVFIFVPQVLQKICLTGLTRTKGALQEMKMVNAFVKYSASISFIQFVLFILLGPLVLSFIDAQNDMVIYAFGIYIIAGISLFNIVRPIHAYCVARAPVRKYFFHVFLPTGIVGAGAYMFASSWAGALATAQANMLVYALFAILTVLFAFRHAGYTPMFEWVSAEEKELVRKICARLTIG